MGQNAPLAFAPHNHASCREAVLAEAKRICREKGARLTPQRERVLSILLETHKPMGAYSLLERLAAEGQKSQPPMVYRALDFLTELNLVHKIQSLNAFIACARPNAVHPPQFLICQNCAKVAELVDTAITSAIEKAASAQGFAVSRTMLEAVGLCPQCQSSSASAAS